MNFLDSPKDGHKLPSEKLSNDFDGHNSGSSPEELPSDDFIKVKLFFYNESK